MPHNPNLKNKAVFHQTNTVCGMPPEVFIMAALFAVTGSVMLLKTLGGWGGSVMSLPWLALVFMPLIEIHRHDAHAWRLWARALWTPPVLTMQSIKGASVIIIDKGVGKHLQQLSKDIPHEKNPQ